MKKRDSYVLERECIMKETVQELSIDVTQVLGTEVVKINLDDVLDVWM